MNWWSIAPEDMPRLSDWMTFIGYALFYLAIFYGPVWLACRLSGQRGVDAETRFAVLWWSLLGAAVWIQFNHPDWITLLP